MSHLIAFDLDGTLIDSRLDLAESANELIASHKGEPLDVDAVAGMVGDGARVLVERVRAASGLAVPVRAALAQFLSIYERRMTLHTRCYPGIEAVLASLNGRASLAVLTNKPATHTGRLLEHLGVARYFSWTIGADGTFPRKPDPASLLHLVGQAGATTAEAVYVGDSMVDVETARRAGVRMCVAGYGFARYGQPLVLDGSELVAATPEELADRLDEFLASRRNAT
jgi:phosphoglycolate phosphatase